VVALTQLRLAAAPAGTVHLPDLHTYIPTSEILIVRPTSTTRSFRYTHITGNIGDGPFEVRPEYDPATDTARGFQRLYTHDAGGTWSVVLEQPVVGTFVFHAEHGHFHFPLVQFGLYQVAADGSVGAPAALSAKIGFCIADSGPVDSTLPHFGVFGYGSAGCSDPRSVRGISVGWGDRYDNLDDGQSIDITSLPDGAYWFRAISDPFNYFTEKDKTNNITDIKLQITGTTVTILAGPLMPNSQPPSISMTAPPPGNLAGTNVVLSAEANDPSGITSVQFLVDGNPVGSSFIGYPYAMEWNSTTVADGVHYLSAQARAGSGFYGTAVPVVVTVANNGPPPPPPPSSLFIANVFVGNRTPSSATVTWTTNQPASSRVDYGLNASYGSVAGDSTLVTTHAVPLGNLSPATVYHYTLTSVDGLMNTATTGDFVFSTPAVSELSCSITMPVTGDTLSGIVTVAADSAGTASVAGVQFKVDGNNIGAEVTSIPYSVPWDTTTVANGSHDLTAVARDPTSNQAVCGPVTVAVANGVTTLATGLVAAYGFNEGGGITLGDSSGHGHVGALSGPAWSAGKFGSALSFDGINDVVTIADSSLLDLTTGMTLEAWVYPRSVSSWRTILIKEQPANYVYSLYGNTGINRPAVLIDVVGGDVRAPTQLAANTWTHLAATSDGATLRLYRNGTEVSSRAVSGAITISSGSLRIGGNSIWGEYFDGLIDEIRIYNRALAPGEVTTSMNTPVSNAPPPPDTTPPVRSNGQPSGTLPAGTTGANLQLSTDEIATCRYASSPGTSYSAMATTFATTGGVSHSTPVSGLTNGNTYTYYVRCADSSGNANITDFPITFSVATPPPDTTPPVRSNGQPVGTLPVGTTTTTLQLTTDEAATCRYATAAGTSFAAMPNVFATTGGTGHATGVGGLANGNTYTFYVRCIDSAGNANTNDFVITFSVAAPPPPDTTPPVRSNGVPTGTLAAGTTSTTLQLTTNESATCRYAQTANTAYGAMTNTFSTTGGTSHATTVTGLANGGTYAYYVRCIDGAGNANADDFTIAFSVATGNTAGLVAAYGFNEGTGITAGDSSGNGLTGTLSGPTWIAAGRFGGALSFDGVNDLVTVPDANALDLTTAMTIEAWVYPTAISGWRSIVLKERPAQLVYSLYGNTDTNRPSVEIFTTATRDVRGTAQLALNTWTHLAATYDGATLRLYRNGVQVASRAATGAIAVSANPLRIGGNTIWGEYFAGRIDDVRIYNRVRTAADIQTDMNTAVP
jgi:hypothetical protein